MPAGGQAGLGFVRFFSSFLRRTGKRGKKMEGATREGTDRPRESEHSIILGTHLANWKQAREESHTVAKKPDLENRLVASTGFITSGS